MYYIEPGTRRMLAMGGVGMLVLISGVWAVSAWTKSNANAEPASTLPKELSVEALKAEAAKPSDNRERMREVFNREDLTEEQRQELRRNIWEVRRTQMEARMEAYFAAAPEAQPVILDQQIDELVERMNQWRSERPEGERGDRPGRERRRASDQTQNSNQAEGADSARGPGSGRGSWGGNRPRQTQQQRKQRSEDRNADQMGRRMAYFTAMRARAQERGIEMPGRGGGGRGR
jgi:hypothetical protein